MHRGEGRRIAQHRLSRRFIHKSRTACARIPVVVREVMKTAFSDRPPLSLRAFERHRKIEWLAGDLAMASADDARTLIYRSNHCTLVRVTRQEWYGPRGGRGVHEYRVHVAHDLDPLRITIGAGMKVRSVNVH